jgi:hypothetical protein
MYKLICVNQAHKFAKIKQKSRTHIFSYAILLKNSKRIADSADNINKYEAI